MEKSEQKGMWMLIRWGRSCRRSRMLRWMRWRTIDEPRCSIRRLWPGGSGEKQSFVLAFLSLASFLHNVLLTPEREIIFQLVDFFGYLWFLTFLNSNLNCAVEFEIETNKEGKRDQCHHQEICHQDVISARSNSGPWTAIRFSLSFFLERPLSEQMSQICQLCWIVLSLVKALKNIGVRCQKANAVLNFQ